MDAATLETRLIRMEQRIAELERENQELRAAAPDLSQGAKEGELLPRRDLLKGAAYALGAVGMSLVSARPAEAAIGTMRYGTTNVAGTDATGLTSTNAVFTLAVLNDNRGAAAMPSEPWLLARILPVTGLT